MVHIVDFEVASVDHIAAEMAWVDRIVDSEEA